MAPVVVPDASVVVKWVLPEAGSAEALALADTWAAEGLAPVVPTLLWSEVGNVLHRRTQAGDLKPAAARRLLRELLGLGLKTRSEVALCPRALELAQELRLPSVYDAVYLALAEAEGAEFWTFDARLHRAASGTVPGVRLASAPGRSLEP
ncbi:MAG: type II toxin-antitoxin system VapC family toxin [Actinomycetota bacterium]